MSKGLYFITRRKNNKLYYHSNSEVEFCNCYDVKNLETSFGLEEPQDSNISMNNKNIQKIMEIIRILLSYSLLDNKIRDKISLNINDYKEYYKIYSLTL